MLPQWLAQPDIIHRDIKSNLVPLADVPEISEKLAKKLLSNGIRSLFPGNIIICSTVAIFKHWQELKNLLNLFKIALTFSTVQKEVIPAILESAQQGLLIGQGGYKPRDICVSAPTGSGKTLAFVIPVVQVSSLYPI